jgi:hypothetical protein
MVEHDQLVELIVDQGVFAAVHLYGVPKLQHLTFNCWWYQAPLTFGCVPQLSKLSLGKRGRTLTRNLQLSQLLANVPSIRDMHLDFVSEKVLTHSCYSMMLYGNVSLLYLLRMIYLPLKCTQLLNFFSCARFGLYQNALKCLPLCFAN